MKITERRLTVPSVPACVFHAEQAIARMMETCESERPYRRGKGRCQKCGWIVKPKEAA